MYRAGHRIAINVHHIEESALFLVTLELLRLSKILPHRVHLFRNGLDVVDQAKMFERLHDLVSVGNGINVMQ